MINKKPLNLNNIETYHKKVVEFITSVVCKHYNYPVENVYKRLRKGNGVIVRHTIVYLADMYLDITLREISSLTGYDNDHSMILHIKKKIDGYLSWDKKLQEQLATMKNTIEAALFDKDLEFIEDINYLSMNNFTAARINMSKAIVFVGYSPAEIDAATKLIGLKSPLIEYRNTGVYIFNNEKTDPDEQN